VDALMRAGGEDDMAQNKNQGNQGNQGGQGSQGSEERGQMTVEEAGRMGGQRVRELVNEGKELEGEQGGGGKQQGGQGGQE
jgi:hypothetical protein